ncbi:asparaginase [Rugosimonospora africana]|uniref:L-asparaginase n=1 Tax=Rugosimonospora africana TaxID=556532 RepID=A0A8J3QQW4_9ACTN|nr:asparaginase domain-containing protein [Rugosimonospora africana]GIH14015.1 L-asparaginase [Rugosimonospora africana]
MTAADEAGGAGVPSGPVVLFALGGTISMAGRGVGGVMPRLTGRDLLDSVAARGPAAGATGDRATDSGGLAGIDVEVHDAPAVPSPNLTFGDILDVVAAAGDAVAGGARGVVVTQGTDTLEETAFLVDSVWPHDAPFVLTGAMRNPTLPGADGPANIAAALAVAASGAARGRGALVVMDDDIHAARFVRKAHSTSTAAFVSPDAGPLGHLVETVPRFLVDVPRRRPVTGFTREAVAATRIALYPMTLDDDGAFLRDLERTHHGLVVAGFGVGHVPAALAPVLGGIAAAVPVVLTSRTGAGPVLSATYGAVGSERDLRERGLIGGGYAHPYQARVLLRLLVAAGASTDAITRAFAELG